MRHAKPIWLVCEQCGDDFAVKPSRIRDYEARGYRVRYCSMYCRIAARNPVRAARMFPGGKP